MSDQPPIPRGYVSRAFDLSGRVAVVTGGASGLGAAIAVGLAQAGASIVLADLDADGLEQTARAIRDDDGTAVTCPTDVTSRASLEQLAMLTEDELGPPHILVNSAGWAYRAPAEDYPEDIYDRIMAINAKGTYLACQVLGRLMLREGRGSIINIASIGGFIAYPGSSAYIASKGAVVQMTRAMSLEWSPRGVRVNGIGPTLIDTPLTRTATEAYSSTSAFMESRMPRGRRGLPEHVVAAAVFLAGDGAELVTGHTLMCDDGYLTT